MDSALRICCAALVNFAAFFASLFEDLIALFADCAAAIAFFCRAAALDAFLAAVTSAFFIADFDLTISLSALAFACLAAFAFFVAAVRSCAAWCAAAAAAAFTLPAVLP